MELLEKLVCYLCRVPFGETSILHKEELMLYLDNGRQRDQKIKSWSVSTKLRQHDVIGRNHVQVCHVFLISFSSEALLEQAKMIS